MAGGYNSLVTSHPIATARYSSAARKMDLVVLGAIMALLMIHGIAPEGFDPLVLQYFVHGCNLHSLHQTIVKEFKPELHDTIQSWITTGPGGDVTPFQAHYATYHGCQVCSFCPRNTAGN